MNRGFKKKKTRHTFLSLRSATLWHKVKLPTTSPNPSPAVRSKEQTFADPKRRSPAGEPPPCRGAWVAALAPHRSARGSARPSPSRSPRLISLGVSPFPRAPPTPLSPRSSPPGTPHLLPTRLPEAPRRTTIPGTRHLTHRPSAARCCPLTAGPGGSPPSPGLARGCPAPPPSRPAGPPPNRCQPRRRPATSGCALLSSSPLRTTSLPTRRNNNPKQLSPVLPHRPLPLDSLPARGRPVPLPAPDGSADGRSGGGGVGGQGLAPRAERPRRGRASSHPSPDAL